MTGQPSTTAGALTPNDVTPFTPSELIYLRGDEFAKKAIVGNTKLMHKDEKVDAAKLGQEMLTAAVLAAEATGAVRLEVGQRKTLFGLIKWKALEAVPTGKEPVWPTGTFEGTVERWAASLAGRGEPPRVHEIIYGFMESDSSNPWGDVMRLTQRGMGARGVLDAEQKKVLKVFNTTTYTLPEATASQAAKADVQRVRALIEATERDRPELAALVRKTVKSAVGSRQEASDGPD